MGLLQDSFEEYLKDYQADAFLLALSHLGMAQVVIKKLTEKSKLESRNTLLYIIYKW